jgi:Carboxypeptidase regulatory-like domain/TonB dependent receptor-like, beta-barrel
MKSVKQLLFVTLITFMLCNVLCAQQPTGTVNGVVLDPSGAAVAGAKVTIKSQVTGLSREATAREDGTYVFPLLPAASYEISAEASGFKRAEQKGIALNANISLTVNFALQVGEVSEVISVEGGGQQIDTSTGTLRQVIEERQVVELPLVDRNPARLILLAPGTSDQSNVAITSGGGEQAGTLSQFSYPGALVISSNGGRGDGVNYVLDGGNNRDPYLNVNGPTPNPDALKEFVIQTNNVGAEHGSATGGVVTFVTKSGTNSIHGSAFEFLRNDALNATPFFNKAFADGTDPSSAPKDVLKRNQFGATVGGPIIKDRLFYFGSYQGLILRTGATRTRYFVPTDAERNAPNINPVTKALVEGYFPRSPDNETGVIFVNRSQKQRENQYLGKVDYTGTKQNLYVKTFFSRYPKDTTPGEKGNLFVGVQGNNFIYDNLTVGHNYTFGPSLLNNLTFAYHNLHTDSEGASPIGMGEINPKVASSRELRVSASGSRSFSTNFLSRDREIIRHTYQFTDNAHWIRGKHDFAFGGELLHQFLDYSNPFRQAGFYRFSSMGNFLAGNMRDFTQGGGEYTEKTYWSRSLYISDNFRVSKNLSLNLGLRWDPFAPPLDKDRKATCFAPGQQSTRFPNAPIGVVFAGEPGCPDAGFNNVWNLFAPRLGFAYNVQGHGRTTLRGGIGVAYQPPFLEALNNLVANPPFSPQVFFTGGKFDDPYGSTGRVNPFPDKFGPRAGSADDVFDLPAIVTSYESNWKPPRAWSYNFTIEHQLTSDVMVRGSYIGALGRKLGYNTDFNFPTSLANLANDIRPNPAFGKMTQNVSKGRSNYNAMQLGVNKRFSRGLLVEAHYTWAKSIDEVSSISDLDSLNVFNPLNPTGYRAVADFDIRHRFVADYVWDIPTPWKTGILKHVLGGWELSGVWAAQTGAPFNVTSDNNVAAFEVPLLAMSTAPARLTSGSKGEKLEHWFDTSAFAATPDDSFGSAPRNALHGPGSFTVDFGLFKSVQLVEKLRLQFRAEFFNAFNRANFNLPDGFIGSVADGPNTEAGRITGTQDPRIIQFALKLIW